MFSPPRGQILELADSRICPKDVKSRIRKSSICEFGQRKPKHTGQGQWCYSVDLLHCSVPTPGWWCVLGRSGPSFWVFCVQGHRLGGCVRALGGGCVFWVGACRLAYGAGSFNLIVLLFRFVGCFVHIFLHAYDRNSMHIIFQHSVFHFRAP